MKSKFIFFLTALILVTGILTYFQTKNTPISSTPNPTINPSPCGDLATIASLVKTSITGSSQPILDQPDDNSLNRQYRWHVSTGEPARVYPATSLGYLVHYYGQAPAITDSLFRSQLLPKILALGYLPDRLNTVPLHTGTTVVYTVANYGFRKNSAELLVSVASEDYRVVHNQQIDVPEGSSVVQVQCGVGDPALDAIYTPIILAGHYSPAITSLEIQQHSAKGVILNVMYEGSGHVECWLKHTDVWAREYAGQEPDLSAVCSSI
jgi:hypothetical protein